MQSWLNAGASLAWLIDPYAAEVVIYKAGLGPEYLKQPDWVEADSEVTGFRLGDSEVVGDGLGHWRCSCAAFAVGAEVDFSAIAARFRG